MNVRPQELARGVLGPVQYRPSAIRLVWSQAAPHYYVATTGRACCEHTAYPYPVLATPSVLRRIGWYIVG